MAVWWHVPTVLGAMTIGGLSLQGVTRDNWEPQQSNTFNRSVWETLDETSTNPAYKSLQERARDRDFSDVMVRGVERVKKFISPGSGGGTRSSGSSSQAAPRNIQRTYSWNYPWKRELNSPYGQSQYANRNNPTYSNRTTQQTPSNRNVARQTTTRQTTTRTQTNNSSNTWSSNNSIVGTSTQYASNSPQPPVQSNTRRNASAAAVGNAGYQIVIETNGGMEEATLIERQLRDSGYRNVQTWQKAGDRKVRIEVGDRMDQVRSDAEFAKIAKTLRTFTFYSDITLQQL